MSLHGSPAQESLPFAPGAGVLTAVAEAVRALHARRRDAAAGRQRLVAALSRARGAAAPLLGSDARAAVAVLHPVALVHVVAQQARAAPRPLTTPRP